MLTRRAEPSESRQAFTLIELLVVIGIVAILASLLLPVLSKAKAAALATECRGNLHDVGLGMRMYLDEFERYPLTRNENFTGWSRSNGSISFDDWKQTLLPYVGLAIGYDVVGSPGNTEAAMDLLVRRPVMRKMRCPQVIHKPDGAQWNGQYAYNASGTARFKSPANLGLGGYLQGQWRSTAEARVVAPAQLIAVGDVAPGRSADLPCLDAGPASGSGARPTLGFFSSCYFDVCSSDGSLWPGNSHNGQANMLFSDGHVESAPQTNWVASSETIRRRWNNDHEPHPETWTRP